MCMIAGPTAVNALLSSGKAIINDNIHIFLAKKVDFDYHRKYWLVF